MMKKNFGLLFIFLFILACDPPTADVKTLSSDEGIAASSSEEDEEEDSDSDEEEDDDEDDEDDDEDSGSRSSSCRGDDDCLRRCDEAASNDIQRKKCEELSPSLVEGFYRALNSRLKNPIAYNDLSKVQPEDIKNIMRINYFSLMKNIRQFDKDSAEKTLEWIAGDSSITKAFYSNTAYQDEAEDILEELFQRVASKISMALRYSLEGSKNFLTTARLARNYKAISWANKLFVKKCLTQASTNYSRWHESRRKSICILGELYCLNKGKTFEPIFEFVVDSHLDLIDFLRETNNHGLGIKDRAKSLDLPYVCSKKKRFCKKFPGVPAC